MISLMQYYFPELNIFDPTLRYDLDTSQNKYQQLGELVRSRQQQTMCERGHSKVIDRLSFVSDSI